MRVIYEIYIKYKYSRKSACQCRYVYWLRHFVVYQHFAKFVWVSRTINNKTIILDGNSEDTAHVWRNTGKKDFRFLTTVELNKRLKKIIIPRLLHTCAAISELTSYIRSIYTMFISQEQIRNIICLCYQLKYSTRHKFQIDKKKKMCRNGRPYVDPVPVSGGRCRWWPTG